MKILMVCLGNICRSPLAEGLLKSMTGDNITIDSAGTSNHHIESNPDKRMIKQALKNGIDISQLQARQLVAEDFEKFDRIYAMDEQNKLDILSIAATEKDRNKVFKILDGNMDVPDPYFDNEKGFELVYKMLNKKCQYIAQELNE